MNFLLKRMNRELKKMKFRALASAVLIILSVSFYIAMAGMVPNAENALESKAEELQLNDYMVRINGANETKTQELNSISGIEKVESRVQISSRVGYQKGGNTEETPAYLYGIAPNEKPDINIPDLYGKTSVYFYGNGTTENGKIQTLLERNFAEKAGMEKGDILTISGKNQTYQLEVIGLVFTPEYIMLPVNPNSLLPFPDNMAVLFLPDNLLREAYGMDKDFVNEFTFIFDEEISGNKKQENAVQREINRNLESNVILYTTPKEEVYGYALVKEDLAQGESTAALFAGIILLVAFFIVYVSFARTVTEQKKEIGILRALGYSRRAVFASYLYLALIIGFIGSIVGVLIGIPLSKFMGEYYTDMMMGTTLEGFEIQWSDIIKGFLFGPVTACLASGIAVRATVNLEPQDAIRGTPKTEIKNRKSKTKFPTPEISAGKFDIMNAFNGLKKRYVLYFTLRNMSKNRFRTLLTTVGIALSILIASLPLLMVNSFFNSMDHTIEENEKWDILVEYSKPLEPEEAEEIYGTGIENTVNISRIQGYWTMGEKTDFTLIVGLDRRQKMHRFSPEEGRLPKDENEIMVNLVLASENDLDTGDIIKVNSTNGGKKLKIVGLVNDPLGEIFVNMSVMEELTGKLFFSGMYVKVEQDNLKSVKKELVESPLVSEAITKKGTKSGLYELMESSVDVLYIFGLMGVIIAAATLANTIFIGVLERYYDYGKLRAMGYSGSDITHGIMAEVISLIFLASIIGLPLTYGVLHAYETEFQKFFPSYETILAGGDWLSYLFIVILTVLFGLLSIIPSLRMIGKMDVAKTVAGARFG